MRFTLKHPHDPSRRAEYGWDPFCGFWVDILIDEDVAASYSAFEDAYNTRSPLWGALVFMAQNGFLNMADIEDAIAMTEAEPDHLPKRLRRAAEVVARFKEAAD